MLPTRRGFLVSTGALIAGCGPASVQVRRRVPGSAPPGDTGDTGLLTEQTTTSTPTWTMEPGPEPDPWQPDGAHDPAAFPWGLQTGDAERTSVIVSGRTYEPEVRMVVVRGVAEGPDGWEEVAVIEGLVPDDKVVQVELVELVPDTTYSVALYALDGTRRSMPARFRTALYEGYQRVVRFGATSCLGGNEPWESLSHAGSERFDLFVFLGDTIYADSLGAPDFEGDWETALTVQGMQDVTGSTSVVVTWDDHEVDNNWSLDDPGMPGMALDALESFRRAMPQRVGQAGSGVWRKLSWGDTLDLFVLDCRGERVGEEYISADQMAWLQQGLVDSTATFKIVCNSVPITDMSDVYFGVAAEDRWDGHPVQKQEILTWIRDEGVSGVLWIAGDFHWGALATVGRPGDPADDMWEVFCGPGVSGINPLVFLINADDHYPLVVREHNYVAFECDPMAQTIQLAFIGDDGAVIETETLQF